MLRRQREHKNQNQAAVKDITLQKLKTLPLQTLLSLCLKFVPCRMRCVLKILEDFTEGNSRKSQIKP